MKIILMTCNVFLWVTCAGGLLDIWIGQGLKSATGSIQQICDPPCAPVDGWHITGKNIPLAQTRSEPKPINLAAFALPFGPGKRRAGVAKPFGFGVLGLWDFGADGN